MPKKKRNRPKLPLPPPTSRTLSTRPKPPRPHLLLCLTAPPDPTLHRTTPAATRRPTPPGRRRPDAPTRDLVAPPPPTFGDAPHPSLATTGNATHPASHLRRHAASPAFHLRRCAAPRLPPSVTRRARPGSRRRHSRYTCYPSSPPPRRSSLSFFAGVRCRKQKRALTVAGGRLGRPRTRACPRLLAAVQIERRRQSKLKPRLQASSGVAITEHTHKERGGMAEAFEVYRSAVGKALMDTLDYMALGARSPDLASTVLVQFYKSMRHAMECRVRSGAFFKFKLFCSAVTPSFSKATSIYVMREEDPAR